MLHVMGPGKGGRRRARHPQAGQGASRLGQADDFEARCRRLGRRLEAPDPAQSGRCHGFSRGLVRMGPSTDSKWRPCRRPRSTPPRTVPSWTGRCRGFPQDGGVFEPWWRCCNGFRSPCTHGASPRSPGHDSTVVASRAGRFAGEPNQGLQVMGLTETRALDFDRVLVLDMNEGTVPQTSIPDSFLPMDLRHALHMPGPRGGSALRVFGPPLMNRSKKFTFSTGKGQTKTVVSPRATSCNWRTLSTRRTANLSPC